MKGKDHIRSRGEKNKRIRIKKGGKTRGKSIGKLGRGGGDKNQQPLELDGDPANACDTEKATKYIANLPEPHAVNTEAQIVSSHWHLYNSQPAGELAIGEAHSSLLFANTVIASSYSHHSHSHLSSRVLFQHSVLFLHERDPPNIAAKHGVNTEL